VGSQVDEHKELALLLKSWRVLDSRDERILRWESKGQFTVSFVRVNGEPLKSTAFD